MLYGLTWVFMVVMQCVKRCAEKFLGVSGRVGLRFQEFSAEQEKKQMEQLQKMQGTMR